MQDDNLVSRFTREFVKSLGEIEFFPGEKLGVKTTDLSERCCFHKDERARE